MKNLKHVELAAAEQAQQAVPVQPGVYAILYRDNWDGEGDTYHTLATRLDNGAWLDHESGASLLRYEGDAILRVWPLTDDKAQQQAEPVARDVLMAALNEVKQTIHDYRVTIDDVDLAAIADRHAAQPPAVANRDAIRRVFMAHGFTIKEGQTDLKPYVYEAAEALLRELSPAVAGAVPDERAAFEVWLQENIDDTDTVRPSKEKVDAYFAVWLARAMLAAAPQVANEAPDLMAQLRTLAKQHGWNFVWSKARLIEEGTKNCHKCHGSGLTHSCLCVHYDKAKEQEAMAEYRAAAQKGGAA